MAVAIVIRFPGEMIDRDVSREDAQAMLDNLYCRLGRHRWHQERTEDGSPYMRCEQCGKDRFGGDHAQGELRGGLDSLGGSIGGP